MKGGAKLGREGNRWVVLLGDPGRVSVPSLPAVIPAFIYGACAAAAKFQQSR